MSRISVFSAPFEKPFLIGTILTGEAEPGVAPRHTRVSPPPSRSRASGVYRGTAPLRQFSSGFKPVTIGLRSFQELFRGFNNQSFSEVLLHCRASVQHGDALSQSSGSTLWPLQSTLRIRFVQSCPLPGKPVLGPALQLHFVLSVREGAFAG